MSSRSIRRGAAVAAMLLLALSGCSPSTTTARSTAAVTSASAAPSATPIPTFGALPTASVDAATAAALQKVLDGALQLGYPDVLATVISPAGQWSGAAGVDGPNGRKAKPDDVVAVASVTKTFTAALILKLAEQQRIDLDAPLAKYLTGTAATKTNGATVRQALAMRAGIPESPSDVTDALTADPTKVWTQDEVVATFPEPDAQPGASAVSSNPTYKLLAFAAEHITGRSFDELVRTELVEPADVPGVLIAQKAGSRTPGTWAVPTTEGSWGAGGALPFVSDASYARGSSDMAADTRSLATWAWALFAGRVLSPSSTAAMTGDPDGSGIASGLDPYSAPLPDGTLGHQGAKPGFAALFAGVPSSRTVVVVALNDADAAVDVIAGDLLTALG